MGPVHVGWSRLDTTCADQLKKGFAGEKQKRHFPPASGGRRSQEKPPLLSKGQQRHFRDLDEALVGHPQFRDD